MNKYTKVVFDEWVYGTNAVYTPHGLNKFLSLCNSMTVQVIVDQATGTTPTITVTKETACDERSYTTATTLVAAQALTAGATNVFIGSGSDRVGSATRLNVTLGGTSPVAHVRLLVTLRTELG